MWFITPTAQLEKLNSGIKELFSKRLFQKRISALGKINSLVILALKEIGLGKVTGEELKIILLHLKKEKTSKLKHDIKIAPEWIRKIMRKAEKK